MRDYPDAGRVFDAPDSSRFTVSRDLFTDTGVFERELKNIFEGGWVYLAHESQLPGTNDYLTTRIGRKSVLLTRAGDGAIHAFINACTHRGAALSREESGNTRSFVCPYHGWTFNIEGRNVLVKGYQAGAYGAAFDAEDHDLLPLPRVANHRGFIFGSLTADVPPIEQHLAGAAPFIDMLVDQSPDGIEVIGGNATFRYRGNWKLQLENGVDVYHFTTVHQNYIHVLRKRGIDEPADSGSSRLRSGFDPRGWAEQVGWYDLGRGHTMIWLRAIAPESRPLWEQRAAIAARLGPVKAEWMVDRQRNLALFPNVQLMDQNSTQIRVIHPIAPDLTEVKSYCFGPRGESAEAREQRIRQYEDFFNASGLATPDDLAVFESVQVGCTATPSVRHGFDRGMRRPRQGSDDESRRLGFEPCASGEDPQDELLYHGMYRQWVRMMDRGQASNGSGGQ